MVGGRSEKSYSTCGAVSESTLQEDNCEDIFDRIQCLDFKGLILTLMTPFSHYHVLSLIVDKYIS